MKTNWTAEQQQAIDTKGKNLLVSAAAGSGKTAVLVQRIIRIIKEQRVPINHMLIVTFTNAAAGEMKQRIQRKLQEIRKEEIQKASRNPEDKELVEFLGNQIQNVARASISTVHSFCISVLRDHANLVGIDPAFKLVNEAYGAILKSQAMEKVLEECYETQKGDFYRLVESYGGKKIDENLIQIIRELDNVVHAKPNPKEWLLSQKDFYKRLGEANTKEGLHQLMSASHSYEDSEKPVHPLIHQLVINAKENVEEAKDYLSLAQTLAQRIRIFSEDSKESRVMPYEITIANDLELLNKSTEVLENQGLGFFTKGSEIKFERLKSIPKEDKEKYDEEIVSQIKNLRDEAKTLVKDKLTAIQKNMQGESFWENNQYIAQMVQEIIDITIRYRSEYQRLKKENALLDFSDLEHLTLEVLEDAKARESLQQKYSYIFFDEYQDSNLVQETIIDGIKREDNLFFVGDVKQSIYGFRLADPTIFNNKYNDYKNQENDNSNTQAQKIDLAKNFRSRKEILRFCNLIFKGIMSPKYGDLDYKKEKEHHLDPGREFPEINQAIQIGIIPHLAAAKESQVRAGEGKDREEHLLDQGEEEMLGATELEALYTAREIKKLTAQGTSYKDMAILLRTMKNKGEVFEKVLSQEGIPSYMDYRSSNFDHLEIKCLLDYLRIVDNPYQDEALLGAMTSVFGGFTPEEMIAIRQCYPKPNLYFATMEYAKEQDNPLQLKIKDFYDQLWKNAQLEKMTNLPDFVWAVAENSGFNTYISGLEDGVARLHNIHSLVDKAKEYDETQHMGLFGFLRHIDSILKNKEDIEGTTIIDSENAVAIMSIHKSKGLEYDTVFLCDLSKEINRRDLWEDMLFHNHLGIGLKYKNVELAEKSDHWIGQIIKDKKEKELISEEIRILYVALTRAINRLYLVGSVKDVDKLQKDIANRSLEMNIVKGKSYLYWILAAIQESGEEIQQLLPSGIDYVESKALKQEVEMVEEGEHLLQQELEQHLLDPGRAAYFEEYHRFAYPYQEETHQKSKHSVTELTKEYKNKERYADIFWENQLRPLLWEKSSDFQRKDLGTLVHFVMETLPIRSYTLEELGAELEEMVSRELLTVEEAAVLPKERILSFFQSDLGKRLIQSAAVYREESFLMKGENSLIEGVVDCYFKEENHWVLLDYKTDQVMDIEKHRQQLLLYKEAVESMEGGQVKEAYIYWIAHDQFTKLEEGGGQ